MATRRQPRASSMRLAQSAQGRLGAIQGVVCAFAGASSDVSLVSVSSNSVRSLIKPALHVGEQIGGGVG
jgi:hypothetical protein